jgi:hypothetical protein
MMIFVPPNVLSQSVAIVTQIVDKVMTESNDDQPALAFQTVLVPAGGQAAAAVPTPTDATVAVGNPTPL